MQSLRKSVLASVAAGLFLISPGCHRHSEAEVTAREGILLLGNKDEPSDLDPHTNDAATTTRLLGSLFEGLVNLDNDGRTVLPGVAESWEVSADGLTYTFHLRSTAYWSNGDVVTSEDFRRSFLRLMDPALACEFAGYAFPISGARDFVEGKQTNPATVGIEAPDARTFIIRLVHRAPYWLAQLAHQPFVPVHAPSVTAAGGWRQRGANWTRPGHLIGNGPFVLKEWIPQAVVRVERNPRYWDAAHIRLREVRFFPTDDEGAEERAFRAGQLHVTARLPQTKLATYERDHPEELHVLPLIRTIFLSFNVTRAPFTDARVRRAFSLAIDRPSLVQAALAKLGEPAFAMTRPGTGGYTPPKSVGFDPVEARRLLAEAGYPGGKGLPSVEFTLNGNTGRILATAEVLDQMWKQNLGVSVSVLAVEFKVYLSASRTKQYQLLLEGWGSVVDDPRELFQLATTGDPNNDTAWASEEYDRLFAASEVAASDQERRRLFDQMEKLCAQESPYAPLYYSNQGILVHPAVQGWRDNPHSVINWRALSLH